jgi:3-isopropylmalate dehydratase
LKKEDKISSFEKMRSEKYPWLDGASLKVPDTVKMYPEAEFWKNQPIEA